MNLKLGSKELRKTKPKNGDIQSIKRSPMFLVLDEVIDTYNIGSLFRLSDAASLEKIYLCGNMNYPPSSRIHKAAVGTEEWVPWEKSDSVTQTIKKLKKAGVQIIAVEQNAKSQSYKKLDRLVKFPCAIVVGNETTGVSNEALELSDLIIELPMLGVNKSFNVWGSAAIVIYKILEKII